MDPLSMIGMAAGAIKPLVGLFKGIREKRQAGPPPRPKAVGQPTMTVQPGVGQGVTTSQNPVAQQGLEVAPGATPALAPLPEFALQPPLSAPSGGLAPSPLQGASDDYTMRAIMNGGGFTK